MKTPAYFDTLSGLIPCKVVSIDETWPDKELAGQTMACKLTIKLTASRGAYKRGEVLKSNPLHVVPRSHVRGNRIVGGYRWTQDKL